MLCCDPPPQVGAMLQVIHGYPGLEAYAMTSMLEHGDQVEDKNHPQPDTTTTACAAAVH